MNVKQAMEQVSIRTTYGAHHYDEVPLKQILFFGCKAESKDELVCLCRDLDAALQDRSTGKAEKEIIEQVQSEIDYKLQQQQITTPL